jgi:hypothetical protein
MYACTKTLEAPASQLKPKLVSLDLRMSRIPKQNVVLPFTKAAGKKSAIQKGG